VQQSLTPLQHSALRENLAHAAMLFGRCPACADDFRRLWCAFTCSPRQGSFVRVTASSRYADTTPPGAVAVADAALFDVAPSFGEALYEACVGVQFPATGATVLHTFGWDKGFRYFLQQQGLVLPSGYSPFQIDFQFSAQGLDAPAAACDDPRGGLACAPTDCAALGGGASCPLTAQQAAAGVQTSPGAAAAAAIAGAVVVAAGIAAASLSKSDEPPSDAPSDARLNVDATDASAQEDTDDASSAISLHAPLLPRAVESKLARELGAAVGSRPALVLLLSCACALAGAALAVRSLRLATEPNQLWVPPHSRGAAEEATHDALFGPFFRVLQLVATASDASGRALTAPHVSALLALQLDIAGIRVSYGDREVGLADLCYRPDGAAANGKASTEGCLVQSASNWFQDDAARVWAPPEIAPGVESSFESWLLGEGTAWPGCLANPAHPRCLSPAGVPAFPHVVLGGYTGPGGDAGGSTPWNATSLVVTWLLERDVAAAAWEEAVLTRLAAAQVPCLSLAFSAERSLSDELRRETGMDAPAVALAYLAMFAYVAATLAPPGTTLTGRLLLAAGGLACVAAALAIAAGTAAALSIPASLIAAEVVPFLVLACGVDNMFVLADAYQTCRALAPSPRARAALVAQRVGGAITAAAAAECVSLALGGALSAMPAVRAFAFVSCIAIAADYLLQMGAFLALLVLLDRGDSDATGAAQAAQESSAATDSFEAQNRGAATSRLAGWVAATYTPWLMRPNTRSCVLIVAGAACGLSLAMLPGLMPLGLDQSLALPPNSYLAPYFAAVASQLEVGPPVAWLLPEGVAFWEPEVQDALASLPCANASAPCEPGLASLLGACGRGQVAAAARLAGGANDWLGDYLRWMDPAGALCQSSDTSLSSASDDGGTDTPMTPPPCDPAGGDCVVCAAERSGDGSWAPSPGAWLEGYTASSPPRPTRQTFLAHLPLFLASRCSASRGVSLCGTPYTGALERGYVAAAFAAVQAAALVRAPVPAPPPPAACAFTAFHAPLRSQEDFVAAHGAVRLLANSLSSRLGLRVFPYSSWYVFFEQYAGLRARAAATVACACAAVLLCTHAALRSLPAAVAVAIAVGSSTLTLAAASAACGVSLNALSLANLSAAAGIATEFCIHIAARAAGASAAGATAVDAAGEGLRSGGALVARGVVCTKALGVACLGAAHTRVFRRYYWTMFSLLVGTAAAHALVVLPVLLALLLGAGRR